VYEGTIYIGANTGTFYAIDDSNGQVLWSRFLGSQPSLSCPPPALGFTSTATVALDPTSHEPTVYVAAADGNLYALDASTGDTVWSAPVVTPSTTVNDYYIWGSPTLVSGKLLIGISSNCDTPLVRGGVAEFSQASGARLATWFSVPKGSVGGSVWSSLAAGNASVFATTGNAATRRQTGYIDSVVKLSLDGLKVLGSWKVPPPAQLVDGDFGASPVTYTGHVSGSAVPMVAACNKNGWLYVLRANALGLGPVWKAQLATSKPAGTHHCLASAVFDGRHLIAAAAASVVGGTEYLGSVREFDASTGAPLWEMGLPAEVLGTPALNGSGVLAVATFDQSGAPNSAYLLDASTGKILTTLPTGADGEFAQPVFADGHLFLATLDQGLTAYSVP
jgi:glucose dehydrogenase